MAGYLGASPVPQTIQKKESFTATAGQTTFNTTGYTDGNFINVFLNGVRLVNGTDYTATNGSDIVLTTGANASDVLDFETFNEFNLVNQEFTNSISVEGDGTFDTAVVTVQNSTKENTEGGRESRLRFRGFKSGDVSPHTLAEIQGSHDGTSNDQAGDLIFKTNDGSDNAAPTERLRIDSTGKSTFKDDVGIEGETPTLQMADTNVSNNVMDVSYDEFLTLDIDPNNVRGNSGLIVKGDGTERMRIDSDGKVMVGKTSDDNAVDGVLFDPAGMVKTVRASSICAIHNRRTSVGEIVQFRKDDSEVGAIGINGGSSNIITFFNKSGSNGCGLGMYSDETIRPLNNLGNDSDNEVDLGRSATRFDDIFATNGSIQTSDENEKQNIASLTSAEITAATAISKLFKTFKWKEKVAAKGDNARTHSGVIAQEVEKAMSDAGLDASKYAFWCSNTWWEADEKYTDDDGKEQTRTNTFDTKDEAAEGATERTRLGVRYPELLSFIGAATEQRLTSIEARLDALEAE